jgi:hypothetical protein
MLWMANCIVRRMDATDKMAERLLVWFRKHAPEDGVRIYDDNTDGVSIGVEGHIKICNLVAFLMHGDATRTPGPPPELAKSNLTEDDVQAALQNLPKGLLEDQAIPTET